MILNSSQWINSLGAINPTYTVLVIFVTVFALCKAWLTYINEIKVTAFHAFRNLFLMVLFFLDEFVVLNSATSDIDELLGTNKRRLRNRKLIRLIMIQYCTGISGILVWLDILLTCQFVTDLFKAASRRFVRNQSRIDDNNDPLAAVYLWSKGLFICCIFYYQLYSMKLLNFLLHILYYVIAERHLDPIIKKLLDWCQRDELEGLERHYARGFMGCIEVFFNLCLMLHCLVQRQQYIMLIALYTNVYGAGYETVNEMHDLFEELSMMANFGRASKQELAILNDVCAICLAPMRNARKTPCRHFFHGQCLRTCLKEKPSCPICSKKIFTTLL